MMTKSEPRPRFSLTGPCLLRCMYVLLPLIYGRISSVFATNLPAHECNMPAVLPHASSFWRGELGTSISAKTPTPFAGRIGANQEFSLSRQQCTDPELLSKYPDAAPWVPLRDSLSPKQFFEIGLWKAAAIEGLGMSVLNGAICNLTSLLLGTCLLVYLTILFPVGLAENMK